MRIVNPEAVGLREASSGSGSGLTQAEVQAIVDSRLEAFRTSTLPAAISAALATFQSTQLPGAIAAGVAAYLNGTTFFFKTPLPVGAVNGQMVQVGAVSGVAVGVGTANSGIRLVEKAVVVAKADGITYSIGDPVFYDFEAKITVAADADDAIFIGFATAPAATNAASVTVDVYPVSVVGVGTTDPVDPEPPDPTDPDPVATARINKQMATVFNSPVASVDGWGTFARPYAADSPWNSRPVDPVFDTFQLPDSTIGYFPSISSGSFSTEFYRAAISDPPITLQPIDGRGVINTVYGTETSITLPHWPADAQPASGTDGHLDVLDPTTGLIHSLFEARIVGGVLQVGQYNSQLIADTGWPNSSRYYQGARAVGIPACAGIIRRSEVSDGKPMYEHALTLSLDYSALLGTGTGFVWPASSADNSFSENTGQIPEGALMMLPPEFDAEAMRSEAMKKVARTLKTYGAYVTDRNLGTPYNIYVEGVDQWFNMHSTYSNYNNGWSGWAAEDMVAVQHALRRVLSASGWIDGNGNVFPDFNKKLRMVSGQAATSGRRGGGATGVNLASMRYDPVNDRVEVVSNPGPTAGSQLFDEINSLNYPIKWKPNTKYRLGVRASDPGISAGLDLLGNTKVGTAYLKDGEKLDFTTPEGMYDAMCQVKCVVQPGITGWFQIAAFEV